MIDEDAQVTTLKGNRISSSSERPYRPKRGRPTAAQVSAIDRAILSAATERFLADGYNGASMDAVALAVGVSKGTLYSRYPHKESLFRAVVEDRVAALSAAASKQDRMAGDTLEQRLQHYGKIVMTSAISAESRVFDRLLGDPAGVTPQMVRTLYELRYSRVVRFLAREIRAWTRAEGRPARNPNRVAATLLAALAGWLRVETSHRAVSEPEAIRFARNTIDLLIAGRSGW